MVSVFCLIGTKIARLFVKTLDSNQGFGRSDNFRLIRFSISDVLLTIQFLSIEPDLKFQENAQINLA
jgi:hypothetical protein